MTRIVKLFHLFFFVITLSACQSLTVHLYTEQLTDQQRQQVVDGLAAAGVRVETTEVAIPESLDKSTVLYSMLTAEQQGRLDDVMSVLAEMGWPVESSQFVLGSGHYYTKQNVGVMLLSDYIKPGQLRPATVSARYVSMNENQQVCDNQIELILAADGRYQFLFNGEPAKDPYFADGDWQIRQSPYVELSADQNSYSHLYFEASITQHRDQLGVINVTTLSPMSSHPSFRGCQFISGVRA